jgi:tetratricopeptide (TPR) repeat protein
MKFSFSNDFGQLENLHYNQSGCPDQRNTSASSGSGDYNSGQELLDDFVVDRILGEGGMGKVYLVRSRSSGSQFAVKRAKGLNDSDRKAFLEELQTWIDLPNHPNLVPCRFFRTVGAEVLIFAEYVEGGSLKDWIDSKRLYEGGSSLALVRILDVAIQFAWGLHCLHELGMVHQDVKPGNVLMSAHSNSTQGVKPQVTDYGLARARAVAGETNNTDQSHSVLVSCGGGTPAYWSPEQAAGLPLSGKTDLWSWGVSVLELFTGEVTWMSGRGAAEVLEQYLEQDGDIDGIPPMPNDMVDLLRQCFRQEPIDRLEDLAEAVEKLRVIFRNSTGSAYERTLEMIERTALPSTAIKGRLHASGIGWEDPQVWLEKALSAAGRDPAEAAIFVTRQGVTRRGHLVAQLMIYEEAKCLYEELIAAGRKELRRTLALLCMEKAMVHRTVGDEQGAIQSFDQAIRIREQLVNQEGEHELADDLARGYMNKGVAIEHMGDVQGAVQLYSHTIKIWERLVGQENRTELVPDLMQIYINKANMLGILGDDQEALRIYDHVIAILEPAVSKSSSSELARLLAVAYMNKAVEVGDDGGGMGYTEQAITILDRLVNREGNKGLTELLALAIENRGNAFRRLGNKRGASELYQESIEMFERLINQEGRRELAPNLAKLYLSMANALADLNCLQESLVCYNQAISVYEQLVNQDGRSDLSETLAISYDNKASAASDLGDHGMAEALYEQANTILRRLDKPQT